MNIRQILNNNIEVILITMVIIGVSITFIGGLVGSPNPIALPLFFSGVGLVLIAITIPYLCEF